MSYCVKCGNEIIEGAAFCSVCGASVKKEIPAAPVEPTVFNSEYDREEREFLENTHRLLRWEQKSWNIASKVLIIIGIVYASIFMILFLVGMAAAIGGNSFGGGLTMGMCFSYAIVFGGMFIGLGIVSKKAAEKIVQYINTVYTDISLAYNRCGNVGMLVFNIILGVVSPIFFIINFVRMKSNRAVIERIMCNQNVQG